MTADLYDRSLIEGCPLLVCDLAFQNFGKRRAFYGSIFTISCPDHDNSLIRPTLEKEPGCGRVLVIDGGGSLRTALVGDILGKLAVDNGWSGLVVYGAVRDVVGLATLNLGVKALGTTPRKSNKNPSGQQNIPVTFGGVTFTPGEWLYADEDGIVVSPKELANPSA